MSNGQDSVGSIVDELERLIKEESSLNSAAKQCDEEIESLQGELHVKKDKKAELLHAIEAVGVKKAALKERLCLNASSASQRFSPITNVQSTSSPGGPSLGAESTTSTLHASATHASTPQSSRSTSITSHNDTVKSEKPGVLLEESDRCFQAKHFPSINSTYTHIVNVNGQWLEISCKCGVNVSAKRTYFGGLNGLTKHMNLAHGGSVDAETTLAIYTRRYVSSRDVRLMTMEPPRKPEDVAIRKVLHPTNPGWKIKDEVLVNMGGQQGHDGVDVSARFSSSKRVSACTDDEEAIAVSQRVLKRRRGTGKAPKRNVSSDGEHASAQSVGEEMDEGQDLFSDA